MLNFHSEFTQLNTVIKLSKSRKESIVSSRDAVRDKIRKYFKDELKLNQPKFRLQGSFVINTALNPLVDCEVDIDDGIYLQHTQKDEDWPIPKEAHQLIIDALKNHTQDGCESKTSCVRVIYKKDYHLDLPVYIMKEEKAYLAQTNSNQWINSDSKDFKNWFYENIEEEQNTRIIRYIKSWRDYNDLEITSIELTILCAEYFKNEESRDDLSLINTLIEIISNISVKRAVYKSVSPFENLWEHFSKDEIDKRIRLYEDLLQDLKAALNCDTNSRASTILVGVFGDRFPSKNDKKITTYKEVKSGARPWGL